MYYDKVLPTDATLRIERSIQDFSMDSNGHLTTNAPAEEAGNEGRDTLVAEEGKNSFC